ncbi:hypothetical protein CTAYLR_009458 [Chrysophaeum taylorii]|uniref:Calpain catalytic domain-containing protein n=1 Tax=Chrysophaeum taylorii TaxID=2483200 RepID=A0AAD7XHV9_9STRA|nr:hypothetical protein CTAYLR_009458 [Chrysophaeum taylorii]
MSEWAAQERAFFGRAFSVSEDEALALRLQLEEEEEASGRDARTSSVGNDAALAAALAASDEAYRRRPSSAENDAALAAALAASDEAYRWRPSSVGNGAALAPALAAEEDPVSAPVASSGEDAEAMEGVVRAARAACRGVFRDPELGGNEWVRPEELQFDGERQRRSSREAWRVFRDEPRADDAVQGALGNCWFVSAIAALCAFRRGALVKRLFVALDEADYRRVHGVRLCVGAWRVVVVDERFPASGDGILTCTQLKYASCRRRQLFAPLLEKAYAKLCGGYEALDGGVTSEALYALTGCPCREVACDDDVSLWATVLSAHEAGFVCCASTRADAKGLAPHHAYAVISVLELFDPPPPLGSGARHRLLRLANPHGHSSPYAWKGRWSRGSREWTPESFAAAGVDNADFFFIELEDLMDRFRAVTVCEYRDDWAEVRISPGRDAVVVSTVAGTTEATLSVARPPARVPPRGLCRAAAVVVVDATRPARLVASSPTRLDETATARCHLEGVDADYLAVPLADAHRLALVVQTSKPVLVRRVPLDPVARRKAALAYARRQEDKEDPVPFASVYLRRDGQALFVALDNLHATHWLRVRLSFPQATNCSSARRHHHHHHDVIAPPQPVTSHVPPRHAMLVEVLAATGDHFAYALRHELSFLSRPPSVLHDPAFKDDTIHLPEPLAELLF